MRHWNHETDVEAALEIYGDLETVRYLGRGEPNPHKSLEEQREALINLQLKHERLHPNTGIWAMVLTGTDRPIGSILLKHLPDENDQFTEDVEVGWHLNKHHRGNGYATEAARGALRHGFQHLPVDRILAIAYKDNAASFRVMERLGMRNIGTTSRYYGVTAECYEIRRDEYGF